MILRLAVLVQCRLVTEWTGRRTDTRRQPILRHCASIALRGKNVAKLVDATSSEGLFSFKCVLTALSYVMHVKIYVLRLFSVFHE